MRTAFILSFLFTLCSIPFLPAQETADPGDPNKTGQKPRYVPKDRITSDEYKLSNARIEQINAVLKKYYDRHANLESADVVKEIRSEINQMFPLVPLQKADERSLFAIRDSLLKKVNEKYSIPLDQIRKNAEKEAAAKYPMAKKNEQVKVYYRRGRAVLTARGHYYGFGFGGKSIRLNSQNIPLFDMLPESKSLFDKKSNAEIRKKFADQKIRDYMKNRQKYTDALFTAEYARIRKQNEKAGYIFQNSSWHTADSILKTSLAEMIQKAKIRAELERIEKEAKNKAKQENGQNPDEQKNNENAEEED